MSLTGKFAMGLKTCTLPLCGAAISKAMNNPNAPKKNADSDITTPNLRNSINLSKNIGLNMLAE